MASIANDPGGVRRLLVAVDGRRKTVRLGKIPKKQAEAVRRHVEALASSRIDGSTPPDETSRWLAGVSDTLRGRLVRAGLARPRRSPASATVGDVIDLYVEKKFPTLKAGTQAVNEQAFRSMRKHLGADTLLRDITPGDAEDFRDAMLGEGYAEGTARKRCGIASKLLRFAARRRIVDRDPFDDAGVPRAAVATKRRQFISREDSLRVLAELTTPEMRLLFALSRWGGLRVGSEPRRLTWADVDVDRNRFYVSSPKTERHDGGEGRWVPIFPEIAPLFRDAFERADPGETRVLPGLAGRTDASLRLPMQAAIKRAGLTAWPRLWQNLRVSRQTELEASHPRHVVCSWLGNSSQVAQKHYLMVTDADFDRAAQKAAQREPATSRDASRAGQATIAEVA